AADLLPVRCDGEGRALLASEFERPLTAGVQHSGEDERTVVDEGGERPRGLAWQPDSVTRPRSGRFREGVQRPAGRGSEVGVEIADEIAAEREARPHRERGDDDG